MNDFLDHVGAVQPCPILARAFDERVSRAGQKIPFPYRGIVTVRRQLGIPAKLWLAYRRGTRIIPAQIWDRLAEFEATPFEFNQKEAA